MQSLKVQADEVVVSMSDFGFLVEEFIRDQLRRANVQASWIDERIRSWWPKLEDYYIRHIIYDIEVAIALDGPERYHREPLSNKTMWEKIVKDLRPVRSEFSIDYRCDKCKTDNVKLWRGVHGCSDDDGNKLLCASCLAPDTKVDDEGRAQESDDLDVLGGYRMKTDQINDWLPAVPVGNTYWGYSSVPSQDLEWWVGLPTYPKNK
jgi:hypothetical protein